MSFDFPNTCPDIDEGIEKIKDILNRELYELISEFSPKIDENDIDAFSELYGEKIGNMLGEVFEKVRETNVKMRAEAEKQIDDAEGEIYDLKQEIIALEEKIETLEES